MPKLARKGDLCTHGAVIVTGSPDVDWNSIPAARVDDMVRCPIHGMQPIVTGSPDITANKKPCARVGDKAACGAVITGGSPDNFGND